MAYEKTVWQTGDIVTSEKLNKIENQLEACEGKMLVVSLNNETGALNKTWQEIYDALIAGHIVTMIEHEESEGSVTANLTFINSAGNQPGRFYISIGSDDGAEASSANDYPVLTGFEPDPNSLQ